MNTAIAITVSICAAVVLVTLITSIADCVKMKKEEKENNNYDEF